jgi:hypothetical protein
MVVWKVFCHGREGAVPVSDAGIWEVTPVYTSRGGGIVPVARSVPRGKPEPIVRGRRDTDGSFSCPRAGGFGCGCAAYSGFSKGAAPGCSGRERSGACGCFGVYAGSGFTAAGGDKGARFFA